MKLLRLSVAWAALCAVAAFCALPNQTSSEKLWELRNLGKAFYENPDTHMQAVDALKAALDLAPNSVEERLNYGIALLRIGKNDVAVEQLLQAQKQDPSLPQTWFNLGIFYKHSGDYDKAIAQFKGMLELTPNEPKAHYNLASIYRAKGDLDTALPEFQAAEKLDPYLAGPHFQLFTLFQRMGKREEATHERALFEEVKKRNEGAVIPEDMEWCFYAELYDPPTPRADAATANTRYEDHVISRNWTATTRMRLIDSTGSGQTDLLVWSDKQVVLYRKGTDPVANSGLENLAGVRSIAVGDYDNDGLSDLAVLTDAGATLYHNNHGVFVKGSDLLATKGATAALWVDYDHDNDLDLLVFGPTSAVIRNDGNGTFEEHSAKFPFIKGQALDATLFAVRGDTAARDIVVSYADRPGVLYQDNLNENFASQEISALPAEADHLDIQDVDRDGLLDIVAYSPSPVVIHNSPEGKLVSGSGLTPRETQIRADFNGDHREDHAAILSDGAMHLFTDATPSARWSTVEIQGIKNPKLAFGATVEVKSGAYYSKRIYNGTPLPEALDSRADADTIRITWPNGLIQNETHQKANERLKIAEAQRLSGSCPMIFTWNGKEFQFITDVLGVAPLGASSGDGNYFPVDHDEYIQIPGSALREENGQYRIHITEELHEVSYLDQVQLIALDHPASVDIYTNDKFKSPPYPEFRLFGSAAKIHPMRATESTGADATARLEKIDRSYPDTFQHNQAGVAELHTLDLDFGPAARNNRAALILNGWVDWADGSTFLGASQNGTGLIFPYLQVKDKQGEWETVVEDMGIPSGKPKTIAVDLTGKFLSDSREVRIVTNLCVYWDEIALLEDSARPPARLTPLNSELADLHFRGFSHPVIDAARQQPERFLYNEVMPVSNWNPTSGHYTRYGNVLPLINQIDDKLVVMGSGDELSLTFPAAGLPALPDGWKRDFLLLVDGWAKDADANTAFSQTVLPLPFHKMSAYPYKSSEQFPNDADHAAYIRDYQTRPALRLIRPLAPQTGTH
jgi:tetratricopeptide (TPR) repeat protein